MLTVRNLCKTFYRGTPNQRVALENINLTLAEGEFVTVIGGNGAGKSTLMNAIAGSFLADSGSIELDGRDITFEKEYRRAAMMGRLFQDPLRGTAPGMTIEENLALAYGRSVRKSPFGRIGREERDFFRRRLAAFGLGLEERMDTKVGMLSGGQRQALTLLMATLTPPKLLLLDEHTAALDPATARKVLEITRTTVEEGGLTAIMITHNLQSALELGTRTVMMDEGQIILDIRGMERRAMTVEDLLERFARQRKKTFDDDRVLLSSRRAAC